MKPAANPIVAAVLGLVLQQAHSAPDEERVLAAVRKAYPATVFERALRTPIPGVFDIAGQTGAGRGPAVTSICTTHPIES